MPLSSVELREQRHKLIVDARSLLEKAETEKRNLTQEESAQYDKMYADASDLKVRAERIETLEKEEKESLEVKGVTFAGEKKKEEAKKDNEELRKVAFNKFLRGGERSLSSDEVRSLQMDVNDKGGYLVAPQEFINTILKKVDDNLFLRTLGTVFQLNGAHSLGYPSLDTDPADADWTGEITEVSTGTIAFGKRELTPHQLTKEVKIARKLIANATQSVESIVSDRLAYKLGVTQEKGFIVGSGSGQPLGLFTASANGISTGRDVATGNASTAVTFDGLKNAKGSVKSGYRANAGWLYHRDLHTQISKLKDTTNRYLLQDSVVAGEPDMLLGHKVYESEYAPNTFTSAQYVAIFGDFSYYHIVESMKMELQRLEELYAKTNQIGYIIRASVDGMPALEEAFARVKLG